MSIGDEIRRLRTESGLSQAALAKLLGVSQASVAKIELGGGIAVETLYALCEVFNLDCNHFRKFVTLPPVAPEIPKGKRK